MTRQVRSGGNGSSGHPGRGESVPCRARDCADHQGFGCLQLGNDLQVQIGQSCAADGDEGDAKRTGKRGRDIGSQGVSIINNDDLAGQAVSGKSSGREVPLLGVPSHRCEINGQDSRVLAAAFHNAGNIGSSGAVAVDVGVINNAAITDLLQTVTTATVAGVPAPSPDMTFSSTLEGVALWGDSALATYPGVSLAHQ